MSSLHREDVSRLRAEIRSRQAVTLIEAAAARGELLERAVEGLTDEQIAAIPRLVAWWTTPSGEMHEMVTDEMDELDRIFPQREPRS